MQQREVRRKGLEVERARDVERVHEPLGVGQGE
jgi:hypothetical protein